MPINSKQKKYLLLGALGLILLLGIVFRFYGLDKIPPGIWYDEAYNGLDAIGAYENSDYQIFYRENYGREGFFINCIAFSFKLFSVNSFALRFPSAVFGGLAILGFYLLNRKLKLSPLASLMATFALSFSFWHLNFSRIAFRGIMVPALIIWALYFFFSGLEKNKLKWTGEKISFPTIGFFISGLILGLGLHSYISFRVAPFVFIFLGICLLFLTQKAWRHYRKPILIFLVGACLTAGPILLFFYQHPADFTGRTDAVSVFNNPEAGFLPSLGKSLSFHLGSFFLAGDPNQRHNHHVQSLIPIAWSILMAIGFWISAKNILVAFYRQLNLWRRSGKFSRKVKLGRLFFASAVAQSCFWFLLIPGVLSIEGIPHALRIIGTIPPVFIMIGLAIDYLEGVYLQLKQSPLRRWKTIRWRTMQFSFIGIALVMILAGFSQVYTYFQVWSTDPLTKTSFEQSQFALGKLIGKLPLRENNYLIVNENKQIGADHHSFNDKTVEFAGYPRFQEYLIYPTFSGLAQVECANSQIIFQEDNSWLREQIKEKCPHLGAKRLDALGDNQYHYWVMN